jgi:hypothetical protein
MSQCLQGILAVILVTIIFTIFTFKTIDITEHLIVGIHKDIEVVKMDIERMKKAGK